MENSDNTAYGESDAATCSRSWIPLRFDPISYHNNSPGWSWDSGAIKECTEGDYVKFEDFEEARRLAEDALDTLRITREKYGLGDRHVMREKNREITKLRKALAAAERHMRHGLNCDARVGGFSCTCGMQDSWASVREILSENDQGHPDGRGKTPPKS